MLRFLTSFAIFFSLSCVILNNQAPALDTGDLICESTTTTGTGTVNLEGAVTNYVRFVSQITSGETVPYHIISGDGKLEAGFGTFTDAATDTLSRTATWSTDGSGAELTLSGTSTVCLGPIADLVISTAGVQVFTSGSGATYTPTAGTRHVMVTCTGGGGGGGGADSDGSGASAGGGGEAGGTSIIWYDATELGANAVYTIGTGGGGGSLTSGTAGTDGNDTTFNPAGTGATITGAGGDGGDGGGAGTTDPSRASGGVAEGTATGGDINQDGGEGSDGWTNVDGTATPFGVGGSGGASYWGGGSKGVADFQLGVRNGTDGSAGGAGGSGGLAIDDATGADGGDGIDGICVVQEYGR